MKITEEAIKQAIHKSNNDQKELTDTVDFLTESNAIEGVYDDDSLKQAIITWKYLKEQKELTTGIVLKTHKILMLHHLVGMDKGYFRTCEVRVGNRFGLNYVLVPEAIEHWLMNVNDLVVNGQNENPVFLEGRIREHHVEYEKIHPFVDGNGRTGRMFMNWERLRLGLPILVIKESERHDYYKWFRIE